MQGTSIGWTDATWNPVSGCSKVSEGCRNCYAERLSMTYKQTTEPWTWVNASKNVVLKPHKLDEPLHWKKPRMVFVNSMSDLFHELVPFEFIDQVWEVMRRTPQHTYQILTKRPQRMLEYARDRVILRNVWLGVSAEDNKNVRLRVPILLDTPATIRFVSAEPLLETPTALADYIEKLDWIIVGGESGVIGCREMPEDAPAYVRDLCQAHGVAFYFKQWGGYPDKRDGTKAILDGRLWQEYPHPPSPAREAEISLSPVKYVQANLF